MRVLCRGRRTNWLECFVRLFDDEAEFAVVPLENSTNGSVNYTLDILRDIYHTDEVPIVKKKRIGIVAQEFVGISHCLITRATDLTTLERVYSHPQVWGQCDRWYDQHLKGVERIDVSSTSKAVELAKEDPNSAAIAGIAAADVHQVPVLYPNISNSHDNQTRFLIFSKEKKEKLYRGDEYNTLVSFTVEHSTPGSLCKALEAFAKQNLNLVSIASRPRPLGETPWTYVYFIELHGHETDSAVMAALQDMQQFCLQVRILGSFMRNRE